MVSAFCAVFARRVGRGVGGPGAWRVVSASCAVFARRAGRGVGGPGVWRAISAFCAVFARRVVAAAAIAANNSGGARTKRGANFGALRPLIGMGSHRRKANKKRDRREREVIALARDGVITGDGLRAASIDHDFVLRCEDRGLLRRLRSDLYVLAGSELRGMTARRAALSISRNSALSHWTAAWIHGLLRAEPDRVHFVVNGRGHLKDPSWAHAHSTRRLRPDEVVRRDGLRVTTVERTIRDMAAYLVVAPWADEQIRKLIEEALQLRKTSLPKLERYVAKESSVQLRARLEGLLREQRGTDTADPKSVGEEWLRTLLTRLGLPEPMFNAWVNGHELDTYFPDRRLNIEFDGFAFHKTRTKHDNDRRRDRTLLVAGVHVARLTATDFRDLDELEEAVVQLLELAPVEPVAGAPELRVTATRPR